MGEILRDTALGGTTGAAGAGTAGAISKLAGKAAGAAADVGGKGAEAAFAKAGDIGFGEATGLAMKKLAKAEAQRKLAQGVADATSGALGESPEKTAAMLKAVKSGGQAVGAADQFLQAMNQPRRFSQQHAAMAGQHPGMNPNYQYGIGAPGGGLSIGFGRYY
jgi:hypothetical protein